VFSFRFDIFAPLPFVRNHTQVQEKAVRGAVHRAGAAALGNVLSFGNG
jgi:hypothetical protein